jgi:hypothetical protein
MKKFEKDIEEENKETFEHIDNFYDHFIELFHHRKTIALGLMGLLVISFLVGIGVYFLPYLIARFDPLYSASMTAESHTPIFLGESLYQKTLEALPQDIGLKIAVGATYLLNILAILAVVASVFYFWYWFVKNRHKPSFVFHEYADKKILSYIILALTSLAVFFLNPSFIFKPFYAEGKLGVDILSQMININMLYPGLILFGITFILTLIGLRFLRLFTVRVYTFLANSLFLGYIAMFTYSFWLYFREINLFLPQLWISIFFNVLIFPIGAIIVLAYTFMIIFHLKHGFLSRIFHLELHGIHLHHHHHDLIHGDKVDKIAENIIKNTADGHEMFFVKSYLIHQGYLIKDIEKAEKIARADPRFEEAERHIKHEHHKKKQIHELHKWIKMQLQKGKDEYDIEQACKKKGYTEDDIILAFKHLRLHLYPFMQLMYLFFLMMFIFDMPFSFFKSSI